MSGALYRVIPNKRAEFACKESPRIAPKVATHSQNYQITLQEAKNCDFIAFGTNFLKSNPCLITRPISETDPSVPTPFAL
jgi:hypothetical protein